MIRAARRCCFSPQWVLKEGMKRSDSKNATKADLDVGIHGHEEVLDKGKDGEVVTSHTHRDV